MTTPVGASCFDLRWVVFDPSHQPEVTSLLFPQTEPYCSCSSHSQWTQMELDPAHPSTHWLSAVDTTGVRTTLMGLGYHRLQKVPGRPAGRHLMLTLPTGPPRSCHPLKARYSLCYKQQLLPLCSIQQRSPRRSQRQPVGSSACCDPDRTELLREAGCAEPKAACSSLPPPPLPLPQPSPHFP